MSGAGSEPDAEPEAARLRRAGPEDAEVLTTLRAVMLDALGEGRPAVGDEVWRAATVEWLRELLDRRDAAAAFVIDDGELGVVAVALGTIAIGAPMPGARDRRRGQVFSVVTDPRARRRGHARTCVRAVVDWLDGQGVVRTDLTASGEGLDLYRDLGFVARPWTSMRRGVRE